MFVGLNNMDNSVAILMATYNGESYLAAQLDSIRNQSETNWKLYIRDDGSTDDTAHILERYAEQDSRIVIVHDHRGNVGVKSGFWSLLTSVDATYYFFSDQDDIWLPDKLNKSLSCLRESDLNIPTLVHTNLKPVDATLKPLGGKLYPDAGLDKPNVILASNSVTGCTIGINRILRDAICQDDASSMVMHDWWMGIFAAYIGQIKYISDATILYRQHGNNQVGTDTSIWSRLRRINAYNAEIVRVDQSMIQARAFLKQHSRQLSEAQRQLMSVYSNINALSFIQRLRACIRYQFRKQSVLGTISLWNIIMFKNKRLETN